MGDTDRALSLLHLRKTFSEYCKVPLSGMKEGERKFDRVLPLFCKVMSMYSCPEEIVEQFRELCPFAGHLCRHLVQEMRVRAANQSTEMAALAISAFLLPEAPDSRGWLLLRSVHYIVSTSHLPVIDAVCKAALPSTLVKALYLFFDLPPTSDEKVEDLRRSVFTCFLSLMGKLCEYKCVSEELARKDDLFLLFAGASSTCPAENVAWRKAASQLLVTVASKALSPAVTKYIHAKGCVEHFLSNVAKEGNHLTVHERIEMIICMLCVIKDSAASTGVILQDFAQANGYAVLRDFILRNESEEDGIRNILLMLMSMVTSGSTELRPAISPGLVVLPSFTLPSPSGNGLSVRNLNAFRLLYQIFLQGKNERICETVIDVVHNIYASDAANYFIIDKECPLSQIIELMDSKAPQVQKKILELVEYVVFHLNHIPCKELIALSVLLKTHTSGGSLACCELSLQSAFRILSANVLLKDAFREVGLVETFTWITMHFVTVVKQRVLSQQEARVALLSTDILALLVSGNNGNARVFRESAGSKLLVELICIDDGEWRASALQLMKQLLLLAHSEEHLAALLVILHSPQHDSLSLKCVLLKSLLCVLRESHKVRVMFRRVGGYLCLVSLLLSLEGKLLPTSEEHPDDLVGRSTKENNLDDANIPAERLSLLEFVHIIFKVLTISMRYEPSNAKYVSLEIKWDNLCIALRATGAFDDSSKCVDGSDDVWRLDIAHLREHISACHRVFQHYEHIHTCTRPQGMPASVFFACCIMRFLFNMALDNYEKPTGDVVWSCEENLLSLDDPTTSIVSWTSSVLVHPGALLAMLHLLPTVYSGDVKWKAAAQLYTALIIKALLRPERNQQIMCQANMARSMLRVGKNVFKSEKHLLLAPFYYVLERLSSHAITPTDLRQFLRLDLPLCCRNLEETEGEEPIREAEGGPVPIGRVKALVSMMTPRDHRVAQNPSFVEFDMSLEGFACLLVPSLSPVSVDLGGVGHGERVFPPLNGLTVATWLYVEQFSDKRLDPHPVRLLSIFRSRAATSRKNDSQQENSPLTCLSIQLSSIDHSLLICTAESETTGDDLEKEGNLGADDLVRVALADVIGMRQWMHIAVVLTRSVLKHSQVSVYVNGRLHCNQKLHYVVQNVGGAATHLASSNAVHAIIGTPPGCRSLSRLHFKIASFFLFEEPLSAEAVARIYRLEPHYVGNFQTADTDGTPLISEERICLALSAVADTELNLARIGSMYSKADSAFIAPFLGVSAHDHSTPLRVLLNTVSHAPGAARSFGAVLIGYLGMRTFAPLPVTRLLESIGGVSCLFGLVAMATDSQELYASLKALAAAVKTDISISAALNATRSYQTLAVLLEGKIGLLNSHILHLILSLVGTVDTNRDTASIPNIQTFEDLLCDVDVWKDVNPDLSRLLYEHFYELITDQQRENLAIVRRSSLPTRLMIRLFDSPYAIFAVNDVVFNLLAAIIQPPSDCNSLLKLGQLLAATLPSSSADQYEANFPLTIPDLQTALFRTKSPLEVDRTLYLIYVRNRILNIIANTLAHSSPSNNLQMSEQIVRVLGFDWVLALFSAGVHAGSVLIGLRILLSVLKHEHLLNKFREGSANGGWLTDADSVVRNRAAVLLGFSVAAHGGTVGAHIDINPELSECSGFTALEHLLCSHAEKPQCYLAMLAILVGQPVASMTLIDDFSLDLIWSHVFGLSLSSSVSEAISRAQLCPEAIIPLLSMVRAAVHTSPARAEQDDRQARFASTVVQMLTFLYQNSPDLYNVCHTDEFIVRLFSVLVPPDLRGSNNNKDQAALTPTSSLAHSVLENPCCRSVLDLIKRILCEDVSLSHSGRPDSLLDALIENVPECGSAKRFHCIILSEVLALCMDHMIATDILLGSSRTASSATNTSPVSPTVLLSNFAYFASRVVDCLWSALYTGEPMHVLDFLFKGIALGRRSDSKASPSDALLHALDRAILYLLSRPIDTVQVQMCILDTLSEVVANRAIVLSPSHNDALFFGALTHLLFMLSVTPDILTTDREPSQLDNGSAQVALCASRVWQEVCTAKRSVLEEIFKRGFVCELNAARALLSHAASLQWLAFVDSQVNSSTPRNIVQIQQQIQSKITKVASGLQRLTSRKALSLSSSTSMCASIWRPPNITAEVVQMWIRVHTSLIRELVRAQCMRYHEWHSHVQKWCLQEWHTLEAELTRERGLWGPQLGSSLDKFALDTTEGPCRIRHKLIPNPTFYHQYPYRPHLDLPESKALRAKVAISKDSKLYYEAMKRRRSKTIDSRIVDLSAMVNTPCEERGELLFADMHEVSLSMIQRVSVRHSDVALVSRSEESVERDDADTNDVEISAVGDALNNEKSEADLDEEPEEEGIVDDPQLNDVSNDSDAQKNEEMKDAVPKPVQSGSRDPVTGKKRGPDNQTLLRLLEQGEQLHSMFRCARVQGLDTSEGLLLFGREHYYVVDGFTLLKTREIRDLDFLPQELHDPIVPYMACGATRPSKRIRLCSKFSYDDIREVHRRRYLLQPIAIEVFSADGRNYLLAFPKRMRNRVYQKLVSMAKALKDGGVESVSGQRSSVPVEQTGRVSLLTSLIGQQSVTQRWIRGEMSNFQYLMHLNTLAGRSYNDLSQYPIFPWILSDYSSEVLDLTNPQSFRNLSRPMGAQSAERLGQFLKRYREWDDPSGETPPYMYGTHYSSAMIVVSYLVRLEPFTQQFLKLQGGHFDLADRMFHSVADAWLSASRNNMADVKELIPEFFSLPEMFLNSNHFDLGVKQNGVALDDVILPRWAKGDPREFVRIHRQALECDYVSANLHNWIDLIFGYKQCGEAAVESCNVYHHLFYEGNVDFENIEDPLTRNATIGFINNFGQIPTQLFKKPHPQKKVAYIDSYSSVPGVTTQRLFYHSLDCLKVPQFPIKELKSAVCALHALEKGGVLALEANRVLLSTSRYISWGFPDRSIRIGIVDSDRSMCIHELCESAEVTCCACGDSRTLFTGSTMGTICVWNVMERLPRLRTRRTLSAHTEAVTALLVCAPQTLLVSASRDCTAILWHLSSLTFIRQLRPHPAAVTAIAVNDATGDIATASSSLLFVWSINGQILAVVNSIDSSSVEHIPNIILSIAFSTMNEWDEENVVMCGGSDGVVRIYSIEMVEGDADSCALTEHSSSFQTLSQSSTASLQQHLERQRRRLRMGSSGSSLDALSAESQAESPEPSITPAVYDCFESSTWDSIVSVRKCSQDGPNQCVWQRMLVPRASLTTHTAFFRKDNLRPAPITAIAPSKDHKSLFIGDGVGRVWQWQMGDEVGSRVDHWVQDPSRSSCTQCQQRFSIAERRHHCRNCGHIFCSRCSRFESDIKHMKITKPVRVCQGCYLRLKAQGTS
uniref:WD repeat and FYVE domain-containing protein 3 n=1 Tax=Parascaris univalens TaxID=6257 RepID=A0A914ZRD5_PARUN